MTFFKNIILFFLARHALAHSFYCEFGLCEVDQYCCGDNKCCDKLLDLWYFWLGVIIVIVVVTAVIFLKYYYYRKRKSRYRYNLLDTVDNKMPS